MKVYVVSNWDGVLGVFSTYHKAGWYVCDLIEQANDVILDYDSDLCEWHWFATHGTYTVTQLTLDDADC